MSTNEKHSLLRGYLLGIGAPSEMLEALDALLPSATEATNISSESLQKVIDPKVINYKGVDELALSVRAQNCLKDEGIITIEELICKTPRQLLNLPNFGRICLKEVEQELDKLGLRLAGESVWPKSPEEYETVEYKHLVPAIKAMQKQGMDAQQISEHLRFSKALQLTHQGRTPCWQTIQSIMNSKMYSEFEES